MVAGQNTMMQTKPTTENYVKYLEITDHINGLISKVRSDTGGYSTHNHMIEHSGFKELVDMGDSIVNYIFYLITHEGSCWLYFHLLRRITGENPVPVEDYGRFPNTIMRWLEWYLKSEYREQDDIYHGLVH